MSKARPVRNCHLCYQKLLGVKQETPFEVIVIDRKGERALIEYKRTQYWVHSGVLSTEPIK